jgi:hypothetical protein
MATNSLTLSPQSTRTRSDEYQLSPQDRAAILAGSDSAKIEQEIERQRQDFILLNGTDLPPLPDLLAH